MSSRAVPARGGARCVEDGCFCCYTSWDCDRWTCCVKGEMDCLCLRNGGCCAINARPRGCGLVTDPSRGEICKIGLFCCDLGLVYPTKLCGCALQCLFCMDVASLPCSPEYVRAPGVLGCCFVQCLPVCGCCHEPPSCPALDKLEAGDLAPLALPPPQRESMQRGARLAAAPGAKKVTKTINPDGSERVVTSVVNPDGSITVTEQVFPKK